MLKSFFAKAKNNSGFTLIELLVVTAIIGILGVVSANVVSSVLRSQNKTSITNEIQQNADTVIDKFERDVRQSQTIGGGTAGSGNTVELRGSGPTIQWSCAAAGVFRRGFPPASLVVETNTDARTGVRVSGCLFTWTAPAPNGTQLVRLDFTMSQWNASAPEDLRGTARFRVIVGTRGP